MKRKGFTIIELVMVMIFIGILSAVVIIAIAGPMRGIQLSGAADKLSSDLRYAQTMANGTGKWHGISFEVDPLNRYTIYTTTGTSDTSVENPAKPGSSFCINTDAEFNVTITGASIDGGSKIEFSPLGTPYIDKNGSAITAEGVITLTKNSSSKTVRVTPNTGRIYIQ